MPPWLLYVVGAGGYVGALITGLVAWYRAGPERKKTKADADKIAVDAAQQAVQIQLQQYNQLNDELIQRTMEAIGSAQQVEEFKKQCEECRVSRMMEQRELIDQRRIALIARRRDHLSRHTLGQYELHIETLLEHLRGCGVVITPMMRPQKIREAFQEEMERLDKLDATVTEEIVKHEP